MGKEDSVTKRYLENPFRFADAFNFYFGKDFIDPYALSEKSESEISNPGVEKDIHVPIQRYRDIAKLAVFRSEAGCRYAILGIENQSEVHYAMPVRIMEYDALNYSAQVSKIRNAYRNDETSRKAMTKGEFLSGFRRTDKLSPVCTLVIYWGSGKWDAPKSLHEMLDLPGDIDSSIIPDYGIHVLEPAAIADEDFDSFETHLGKLLKLAKYSGDRNLLQELVISDESYHHLTEEEKSVCEVITDHKLNLTADSKGEYDMCNAFEQILREGHETGFKIGRTEGRIEGRIEGRAEGRIEERIISALEYGIPKEQILTTLIAKFGLTEEEAEESFRHYSENTD